MKPRIYLETTIPSYLAAWPSRDLVVAAHQQVTKEWWDNRRGDFALFVSQMVLQEAGEGDPDASSRRLDTLKEISVLEVTKEARAFAKRLTNQVPLPPKAAIDGLHIALAVVHQMDYLLTWNCTHIANAALRNRIDAVCRRRGYKTPIICTPEELLEK
jgi:hypothetical protein